MSAAVRIAASMIVIVQPLGFDDRPDGVEQRLDAVEQRMDALQRDRTRMPEPIEGR